jgi:hypothetical protein
MFATHNNKQKFFQMASRTNDAILRVSFDTDAFIEILKMFKQELFERAKKPFQNNFFFETFVHKMSEKCAVAYLFALLEKEEELLDSDMWLDALYDKVFELTNKCMTSLIEENKFYEMGF